MTRLEKWVVPVGAGLLAVLVSAGLGHLWTPERWEYSTIADSLAAGGGGGYVFLGTWHPQYGSWIYPRLLLVTGSSSVMVVLQAGLWGTTVAVVMAVARRLADDRAAMLAWLLTAVHPGALVYVGKLHPQTLDTFLIAGAFLAWLVLLERPTWGRAVLTLVVSSLAGWERGPVWLFAIGVSGWLLTRSRMHGAAVLVGLAAALVLLPGRTDVGLNLWQGLHAGATGTSYTADGTPEINTLPARFRKLDAETQDQALRRAAASFVRDHPAEALTLIARKWGYFWWRSPATGHEYPAAWTGLYLTGYLVLIGLAGVTLITQRHADAVRLWLLLAVSLAGVHSLFYVDGRHRWAIEPLLCPFAAVTLTRRSVVAELAEAA